MKRTLKIAAIAASASVLLAGCARPPAGPSPTASTPAPPQTAIASSFGTVESIQQVPTSSGSSGGAVFSSQVEQQKNQPTITMYQVRIRLDNGNYQNVTQDNVDDLHTGGRVRIENDRAYRY